MMIKNVVFDLGNVLIYFKPEEYLKSKGLDDEDVQFVNREIFLSEEWKQLDRGTITRDEAKKIIAERNKEKEIIINECMDDFFNIFKPIEYNVEILMKLKGKGYNTYVLSNFHEEAFEYVHNQFDFFGNFDGGVVSAHVKLLKPEQEIYKALLDKYNLIPEETLFIDDTKENIEAAKEIGINVIHLEQPDKLFELMKENNVL